MKADAYKNKCQQRLLRVIYTLAGNEVDGLRPIDIAQAIGVSQSVVTRDLANLQIGGAAEEITSTGRWRLGPRLPQIGVAMLTTLDRSQQKLDEIHQRFTRAPR